MSRVPYALWIIFYSEIPCCMCHFLAKNSQRLLIVQESSQWLLIVGALHSPALAVFFHVSSALALPQTKRLVSWSLTTYSRMSLSPFSSLDESPFYCAHWDPTIEDCSNSLLLQPCDYFLLLTSWNFVPGPQISISWSIEQKPLLVTIYPRRLPSTRAVLVPA